MNPPRIFPAGTPGVVIIVWVSMRYCRCFRRRRGGGNRINTFFPFFFFKLARSKFPYGNRTPSTDTRRSKWFFFFLSCPRRYYRRFFLRARERNTGLAGILAMGLCRYRPAFRISVGKPELSVARFTRTLYTRA